MYVLIYVNEVRRGSALPFSGGWGISPLAQSISSSSIFPLSLNLFPVPRSRSRPCRGQDGRARDICVFRVR